MSPEIKLGMSSNELHLWFVLVRPVTSEIDHLYQTLAPDEKQRAAAFRFEKDANLFVVGRGLLGVLLASYLGQTPEEVSFQYGTKGKPELRKLDGSQFSLRFNLAHSADCFVYALVKNCEVGIDVEQMRTLTEAESIAQQYFHKEECQELFEVPAEERTAAFFNCWTRKEAYLKAIGEGLSVPLDRFRVSLEPGGVAAFVKLDGDRYPISQWTLLHLVPYPRYIGAVAVASRNLVAHERRFYRAHEFLKFLDRKIL